MCQPKEYLSVLYYFWSSVRPKRLFFISTETEILPKPKTESKPKRTKYEILMHYFIHLALHTVRRTISIQNHSNCKLKIGFRLKMPFEICWTEFSAETFTSAKPETFQHFGRTLVYMHQYYVCSISIGPIRTLRRLCISISKIVSLPL